MESIDKHYDFMDSLISDKISSEENKDHINNKDNQLDKAIEIVLKDLKNKDSVLKPDFKDKPDLKLP